MLLLLLLLLLRHAENEFPEMSKNAKDNAAGAKEGIVRRRWQIM